MKINKYAASAAILALTALASCSGNSEGDNKVRQMADYKGMSAGDSVAYYVGQMASFEYWQAARQDTLMQSREARDAYLKGLRAGYDALRDDDAYNQGYYMGMQLAMQMKEFSGDFNTSVNKSILVNSFEDGLKNDSILDRGEVQRGFTEVTSALQARKEAEDRKLAEEELKKAGTASKWQAVNPSLYAETGKGGEGALVKEGESVGFSMIISDTKGKPIDRRENPDMVVGKMYAGPVTQAILTMKIGETRTFHTYANALLGRFAQRYGMKGTEIVSFTITLSKAEAQPVVNEESGN
ncbi:MAG: FKBP-type peptidyl-prolyl cis-trans isomerase N-terminal domain-containing protein [Muribaculaceae bacterium]|nr:FKBP-type peptidyl-prolyl cis-trans isomerase N-terminal domain-containing protein [Muribaculaceae bacterium]